MGLSTMRPDSFETVLERFASGKPVLLLDDVDRENEGDVVLATQFVSAASLAFLMNEARGLICVSISGQLAKRLELPLQSMTNSSRFQTPFAVSIDHVSVAHHGVTATSRALTMRKLIEPDSRPEDFVSPGHVFPLIAHEAGVLGRQGHTEGVFDLARLTGLAPSGVLCEVLHPDGTMARGVQLVDFAKAHKLAISTIREIQEYRNSSKASR